MISLEQNNINVITNDLLDQISNHQIDILAKGLSKTQICSIVVDLSHIEEFSVKTTHIDLNNEKIVTLYDVNLDVIELLKELDIHFNTQNKIDKNTFYLDGEPIQFIKRKGTISNINGSWRSKWNRLKIWWLQLSF